ncbi:16S rRNA (guanine(966)-N(2))-methyltransferase RsmD [Ascidiimonas aurantiaca]|uniref:16S rRNA (guanine(966)-N(2))-methyltransferase RsmD n=1 Tax=Ascidiimonas aurantiaca TaxID=1685432 RepID=UPI0030ED664D
MRIISGKYRGKRITAPSGLPARPTTDFAKEALFNILTNHYSFEELSVLDLFAGIGNISYEFASRGSQQITAVDIHNRCVQFIVKTSKALDMPISAIKSDALKYLSKTTATYDIIFADPPYDFDKELMGKIVTLVFERQLLKKDGYLILEHSKHTQLNEIANFAYARKYGGSMFSFFENIKK